MKTESAFSTRLGINNQLAFHSHMPKSAKHAAFERITASRLRYEFNRRRLTFFQFPAIVRRREHQPRRATGARAVWVHVNLESVIVIGRRDAQFDFRSLLHVDR